MSTGKLKWSVYNTARISFKLIGFCDRQNLRDYPLIVIFFKLEIIMGGVISGLYF